MKFNYKSKRHSKDFKYQNIYQYKPKVVGQSVRMKKNYFKIKSNLYKKGYYLLLIILKSDINKFYIDSIKNIISDINLNFYNIF